MSAEKGAASRNGGKGEDTKISIVQPVAGFPRFVGESDAELKKVHTPTRAEAMQATMVTLFIMCIVSLVLFVMDAVFGRLMTSLIG